MEKIKLLIFRFLLKKYALGYIVKLWELAKGYKTQICVALYIIVYIAEHTGAIEPAMGEKLRNGLEVAGGFSLMQKLQRFKPYVDEIKNGLKEQK